MAGIASDHTEALKALGRASFPRNQKILQQWLFTNQVSTHAYTPARGEREKEGGGRISRLCNVKELRFLAGFPALVRRLGVET